MSTNEDNNSWLQLFTEVTKYMQKHNVDTILLFGKPSYVADEKTVYAKL